MEQHTKLTQPQRQLLDELREYGPVYHLAGSERAMGVRLLARGLISHKPGTANLSEEWRITRLGRAALSRSTSGGK